MRTHPIHAFRVTRRAVCALPLPAAIAPLGASLPSTEALGREHPPKPLTRRQRAALRLELAYDAGRSGHRIEDLPKLEQTFAEWFGVPSLRDIPRHRFDAALAAIQGARS